MSRQIKFIRSFVLITPPDLSDYDKYPNYLDNRIYAEILKKHGFKQFDAHYISKNINLFKNRYGLGLVYMTGLNIEPVDKRLYNIPCLIKNAVSGYGITKDKIYELFKHYIGKSASKYTNKSWDLFSLNKIPNKQKIYIAKPIWSCKGTGIKIITTTQQLEDYKKEALSYADVDTKKIEDTVSHEEAKEMRLLKRGYESGVILEEYIMNPLLFNGKKFHLRYYFLFGALDGKYTLPRSFYNESNNKTYYWDSAPQAKLLHAVLPYKKGDWLNRDIHDTHIGSSDDDYYYPQDLKETPQNLKKIQENIDSILVVLFKNFSENTYKTYVEAKNSYHVYGLDIMILNDYSVKLIEVNSKIGMGVINRNNKKVIAFTRTYFTWLYNTTVKIIYDRYEKLNNKDIKQIKL